MYSIYCYCESVSGWVVIGAENWWWKTQHHKIRVASYTPYIKRTAKTGSLEYLSENVKTKLALQTEWKHESHPVSKFFQRKYSWNVHYKWWTTIISGFLSRTMLLKDGFFRRETRHWLSVETYALTWSLFYYVLLVLPMVDPNPAHAAGSAFACSQCIAQSVKINWSTKIGP